MSEGFELIDWCESNLTKFTKSAGDEWTAECPECGKWSTFYVNGETGAYICFSCEIKGRNVVGLVALVEDISWSDAHKYIFKRSVKLRRKSELTALADRIRSLRPVEVEDALEDETVAFDLPKEFRPVWNGKKWSFPTYLKDREIKPSVAKRWGLGYCRVGKCANRVIVPINCPNGYSFTARAIFDEMIPKYWNPPGADHAKLLIGWDIFDNGGDFCVVEGPLDAIKLTQHGINVLAVGGKVLHSKQLEMLFKLSSSQAVTVMLDPEEKKAPFKIANQLSVHFGRIYIARLPHGIDPGASSRKQAHRALMRAERFTGSRVAYVAACIEESQDKGNSRYS